MKNVYKETCHLIEDDGEPECDDEIEFNARIVCRNNLVRPIYNQIWMGIGNPLREWIQQLGVEYK